MHRANERHVIDNAGEMGKEFRDIHSTLAVLLEFPRTAEQLFARAIHETEFYLARVVLPAPLRQLWFRVEQIDVTRPAVHEERDHRLGLRAQWRNLGLQIEGLWLPRHVGRSGQKV